MTNKVPTLGEVLIAMSMGQLKPFTDSDYMGFAGAGATAFIGEIFGHTVVFSTGDTEFEGTVEIYQQGDDCDLVAQYLIEDALK